MVPRPRSDCYPRRPSPNEFSHQTANFMPTGAAWSRQEHTRLPSNWPNSHAGQSSLAFLPGFVWVSWNKRRLCLCKLQSPANKGHSGVIGFSKMLDGLYRATYQNSGFPTMDCDGLSVWIVPSGNESTGVLNTWLGNVHLKSKDMVCQLVFKPRICRISCAGKSVHEIAKQFLLKTQADQVGLQDWKVRLWSTLICSAYHMHNSLMRYCLCSTFARSNGVSAKDTSLPNEVTTNWTPQHCGLQHQNLSASGLSKIDAIACCTTIHHCIHKSMVFARVLQLVSAACASIGWMPPCQEFLSPMLTQIAEVLPATRRLQSQN